MTPANKRQLRPLGNLSYRRYWLSLYRRDVAAAGQIVQQSLREWPPQRIYLRLFEPALKMSGTLFEGGRITYADEHRVTYHTLRFMRQVRRRFVPLETFGPLALASGVAPDSHRIGLRMVCDFLQWANWRIHLISSSERGVLEQAVVRLRPNAVLLSLGYEVCIEPARRMIKALRRIHYPGPIVVGGHLINQNPSLVQELGADLTAHNGLDLVTALGTRSWSNRMLRTRRLEPTEPAGN